MKLKTALFIASGLLAGVVSSNAAIYQLANVQGGPGVDTLWANNNGSLMSGTGTVAIGYWATGVTSSDDINTIAELVPLLASFASQSNAVVGSSANFTAPGYLLEDAVDTANVAAGLIGKGVYVIATSAASLTAATTADQFSVFFVRNLLADTPLEETYTGNPSGGTLVLGSYGTFNDPENSLGLGAGEYTTLQMAVVPEPSAALLGAIGVLGLLRRRRN